MQKDHLGIIQQIFSAVPPAKNATPHLLKPVLLYYMNNPDGTVRWVWPAALKQPHFLKFYNTSTPRANAIAAQIRLAFALGLQKKIISGKLELAITQDRLNSLEELVGHNWAMFTGTAGQNRTALFHGKNCFIKVPVGEYSGNILTREYLALKESHIRFFESIEVPNVSKVADLLILHDVSIRGKQLSQLSELHFLALAELSTKNRRRIPVSEWPEWSKLNTTLNHLTNSQNNNIPSQLIRKLNMMRDRIDEKEMVPFHLAHGDFTPWNMFVKKEKLALIDWELSQASAPALFDLFHFLYQQSSLVDHASFPSTIIKIQTALDHPAMRQLIKANPIDIDLHHSLYLLFTAVYYLNLYSKHDQWSPQQRSSIQIWNDGLNYVLSKESHFPMRSLFLLDMFAHLREQRYALLKSPVLDPFQLPEGSDIDICTDSKTKNALSVFISKHPLVQNLKRSRKSFTTNYSILLHDGSFLGVDAITRFKRKDLVMMDALDLLNSANPNTHEVMIPSPEEDMKYIHCFYLLNNAPIPEKYQNLYPALKAKRLSKGELIKALKANPENLGFRKMANMVNYLIDTLRESFFKKGFVITFSGVDGAGKSTVIKSVKHQIEKKYRRKVVVLRHRPALLPMLTAWKHGKEAAEQNAAARLPRQGSNNSTLSSLLRFAYYYTDYLIGQFNVQVKYVWRGYIVLYDRYYFDFINDGKRSNIVLPNWFTRFWYSFLIKPSFNFFLYADAATILTRKKELDEHTIRELTAKYLDLFKLFGKKFRGSKYIPVRNEQLPETMDLILQTIKTRSI